MHTNQLESVVPREVLQEADFEELGSEEGRVWWHSFSWRVKLNFGVCCGKYPP